MKLTVTSILFLSLLLHMDFSLATRGLGFGRKINIFKTRPKIKTNPGRPGSYPRQPSYPMHPGYTAGGYPAGGYHGNPYGGGYGGYINQNPNNKILSPHYGGSFGYGGYGVGGGSPFSHSVRGMGIYPQDTSREFGRSAVMAAAGGAMAGMALGYGLGRFPRPHFHFHSPQEEYYYNHYMYRKYGVKSTYTNDYGRDYTYSQPTKTYDDFMDACMRRADVLPVENRNTTTTAAVSQSGVSGNTTKSNNTAAGNSPTAVPSLLQGINVSEASPVPPVSHDDAARDAEDDDTVSIEEIGYPALIRQMRARRCLELYMVYSEWHLKRKSSASGGARRLEMGLQGFFAVIISTLLMLINSNMLMLPH